jgi:Flp pilus assembly pilin Flp
MKKIKNNKGQGMIEYLIIVAIIAIGSISVMKVVGANLNVQFGNIAQALGGTASKKIEAHQVTDSMTRKKDLSSFFEDSVNSDSKSKNGK